MPALVGGIIGASGGLVIGIATLMVWLVTSQLHGKRWMIVLVAPFLAGVWGIFGGFAAGAVPTEHRWGLRTHRLMVAIFAALGGGTGGFGFGLLIDRDRGLSTPTWTLIAAVTGAICGLLATARDTVGLANSPSPYPLPAGEGKD